MNSKSLIKIITEIFCYLIFINVSIAAPVQENIAKDYILLELFCGEIVNQIQILKKNIWV